MSNDSSCICVCVHTHTRTYTLLHLNTTPKKLCFTSFLVSSLINLHLFSHYGSSLISKVSFSRDTGRGLRSEKHHGVTGRQSLGRPRRPPHLRLGAPTPHRFFPRTVPSSAPRLSPEPIHRLPAAIGSLLHPINQRTKQRMRMSLRITTGHLTGKWSHNMQKHKHPRAIYPLSPAPFPSVPRLWVTPCPSPLTVQVPELMWQ